MVRLSKKAEYGLIAIRHIAVVTNGQPTTAREIADTYSIPYDLLAKVLQKLAKSRLIASHHGLHGGYTLTQNPRDISVSQIISVIEGTDPMIAQCMSEGPDSCGVFNACTIKSPLTKVQAHIDKAFSSMTLAEIV